MIANYSIGITVLVNETKKVKGSEGTIFFLNYDDLVKGLQRLVTAQLDYNPEIKEIRILAKDPNNKFGLQIGLEVIR
jgi:hypothetical protein